MDVARCTLDGVNYQAVCFADLPPNDLSKKRRYLACPECDAPAFFRKASRSGQSACFGARPHKDGCTLAALEYERNNIGLGDDQDVLKNPGHHIVLDFNFGAQLDDRHNDPDEPDNTRRGYGRFVGNGVRSNTVMHRRLSTVLRNLMISEQFRVSQQVIDVADIGQFTVADFFIEFEGVASMHNNQYHGYWGMITDARFGQMGELWLNSGGRDDVSICVPGQFVDELYERFQITDEEELAGSYALVLGTLNSSKGGKKYVRVDDLGFITLQ